MWEESVRCWPSKPWQHTEVGEIHGVVTWCVSPCIGRVTHHWQTRVEESRKSIVIEQDSMFGEFHWSIIAWQCWQTWGGVYHFKSEKSNLNYHQVAIQSKQQGLNPAGNNYLTQLTHLNCINTNLLITHYTLSTTTFIHLVLHIKIVNITPS